MKSITTEEFNEVYSEYFKRLYGSVVKIIKDADMTREIVQDVFMKLLKQDYQEIQPKLSQWLFVVARNTAFKRLKKEKRYEELSDDNLENYIDTNNALDSLILQERIKELKLAMRKLTKKQQDIIKYRFFQDLSYAQCAKKIKLTSGNVGFIQNRAINKLRELIKA